MQVSRSWAWLFPATYLLHIAEEYWGGFYVWLSRVAGVDLSREDFLLINAVALVVMTSAMAVTASGRAPWLLTAFATVVIVNGLLHIGGSIATRSYSPGVVTGALLWVPLGTYALHKLRLETDRAEFGAGVIGGLMLHGLVSLMAFTS
jgi:hypothetical protein